MSNDITDLVDRLTQAENFRNKCREVVSGLADSSDLHGAELYVSLVLSGAALGIEEAMRSQVNTNMEVLARVRTFVSRLNAAILTCADEESIGIMREVKTVFENDLRERAANVRGAIVRDAWDRYRIPESALTEEDADITPSTLQEVGYKTFMSTTMLFFAWDHAKASGKWEGMKCRCAGCIMNALDKLPEDPAEATFTVFKNHGGMAPTFAQFGSYMVGMMRDNLVSAMEGTKVGHEQPDAEMNAEAAMQAAMRALREGKGKGGEAPAT